jgi:hypothetical protein
VSTLIETLGDDVGTRQYSTLVMTHKHKAPTFDYPAAREQRRDVW